MAKRNSNSSSNLPLFLIGGGVVIIIAILLWQFAAQKPQASSTSSAANIPYANVPRVSITDAKTALDNKSAVFVDVRDLDVYTTGHINTAVNIPLGDTEVRYRELDPSKWIIFYCT